MGEQPGPDDPVAGTLDKVAETAEKAAKDSLELARESREASAERAQGATAGALMSSGRPQAIFRLAEVMARQLVAAASALRSVLVRQLAEEGEKVGTISRRFGVSHQRISTLLHKQGSKGKG
ncbi:MAG: hypothetical protein ACRDZX_18135 [Acidimicrobiales bacterium]